ncbi:hypothetical protein COCON_G00003900 [Conger conger]|uniref:Uncharacterized protein n=1 Tax=Conger conger TaxID=82655 RepID=A0A9Q1I8D9_CONCO|nr:hypothetical protein COCON_G00003900 [Conger conger]
MQIEYVQRVMELDAAENHHKFLFEAVAGFNLAKTRHRGRNFNGQWGNHHGGNHVCCNIRGWCGGTRTSYWIL